MTTDISDQIETDIQAAYGSMSAPNWSFAETRYANHQYVGLIHLLANFGDIKETTDLNEDVSVVIFAALNGSDGITLRLSLVGKYACVSDSAGRFLTQLELMEDAHARRIFELLKEEHMVLIEPSGLTKTLDFGDEDVTIYEVLFSGDEAIG
ncbi:MAG: hypothetical protein H0W28_12310 [Pyrinomonadaceae bacterium]|nr:hypothetical protein [Pyrinomonadaceae bacterium]